jgi:hemerythrin-like domain-containing protein
MKNEPIKRSGYLVPFSRDHHAGLLFCWKIKAGHKKGVTSDRIANYVRFFWEEHLKQHFQEEEILLFNQLDTDLTRRGKAEHATLETLFGKIVDGRLKEPDYFAFAEQLTAHIRFEERELFPHLEKVLAKPVLTGIREILIQLHSQPFEDKYPDEFWIK